MDLSALFPQDNRALFAKNVKPPKKATSTGSLLLTVADRVAFTKNLLPKLPDEFFGAGFLALTELNSAAHARRFLSDATEAGLLTATKEFREVAYARGETPVLRGRTVWVYRKVKPVKETKR